MKSFRRKLNGAVRRSRPRSRIQLVEQLENRRMLCSDFLPGDANRDGTFDSSDLVQVFQAGEFEDTQIDNSSWESGDWDGDGEFDTSDLVLAFQSGAYGKEQNASQCSIKAAIVDRVLQVQGSDDSDWIQIKQENAHISVGRWEFDLADIDEISVDAKEGDDLVDIRLENHSDTIVVTIDGGEGADTLRDHDNSGAPMDIVNVEMIDGLAFDGHHDGPPDEWVHGAKWGFPDIGTAGGTVNYCFMPTGVRDTFNIDGGWTNQHVSTFMPSGAIREIERAFATWSSVADIQFQRVSDGGERFGDSSSTGCEIRIGGHAFGSAALAHAYYPGERNGGDIHFDISDNWQIDSIDGNPTTIDIYQVALHEIGHAIGLGHQPSTQPAIMNPIYTESFDELQPDDINGIIALYGVARPNVDVGQGPVHYEGVSPVTAMIPYKGGVLTAFWSSGGVPDRHVVHWSPDGGDLGEGDPAPYYVGSSPVTAMIPYKGGVLTAFSNSRGDPNRHVIHWSPDGRNLGGGDSAPYYVGSSPVTAMIPYKEGVLTAFSNVMGIGNLHRVHWSEDGGDLGGGPIVYEGVSPVTSMSNYDEGVLAAFTNVENQAGRNRIHWNSADEFDVLD